MKKLLFVDMSFHLKTKSSNFVVELLEKNFEVYRIYFDGLSISIGEIDNIEKEILDQCYDYLVLWQVMPSAEFLNSISFGKGIFFPMYDSVTDLSIGEWQRYKEFIIINFSKTLHQYLQKNGFNSKYIQYFPKPQKINNQGMEDSLFFWQRTNQIHINQSLALCENLKLKRVHIHKAIDPECYFVEPSKKYSYQFTYSKWFERKQELIDTIEKSAYYVAPRKYEGIGMSFLDAMAIGRCVIAPDYPTMNEYITDGVTGILYNYENPKLIDPVNVRIIQQNAYRYIEEGYQKWEKEKYKIIEWIEEKTEQEKSTILQDTQVDEYIDCVPKKELEKMQQYYALLWRWLLLKNRKISLEKYFLDKKVNHIAIYGYSEVATRLEEELQNTSVIIDYFIDKCPKITDTGILTVSVNEEFRKTEMIVVTPVFYYDSICNDLIQKVDIPIVSLRDIVDELIKEL